MTDERSERRPIRRALISVYDKTGLDELVRALGEARRGDRLHRQHGGAGRVARRPGDPGRGADRLPGVPGRPGEDAAPGGARRSAGRPAPRPAPVRARRAGHRAVRPAGQQPLPVRARRSRPGADLDACVEQIDIGGPAMVRAAAKNHAERGGGDLAGRVPAGASRRWPTAASPWPSGAALAARAFADIAAYDVAVAEWCAQELAPPAEQWWPEFAGLALTQVGGAALRGEPAPAGGALRSTQPRRPGWPRRGSSAARRCPTTTTWTPTRRGVPATTSPSRPWPSSSTPTRAASRSAPDIADAHRLAHACDPVSAFGGVIAANRPVSVAMAEQVAEIFTEVDRRPVL